MSLCTDLAGSQEAMGLVPNSETIISFQKTYFISLIPRLSFVKSLCWAVLHIILQGIMIL